MGEDNDSYTACMLTHNVSPPTAGELIMLSSDAIGGTSAYDVSKCQMSGARPSCVTSSVTSGKPSTFGLSGLRRISPNHDAIPSRSDGPRYWLGTKTTWCSRKA